MKTLILNADDFCLSLVFNQVILDCINAGTVSSTSVMVDRFDESQREQVEQLKQTAAGIGLHVEFADNSDFQGEVERQYNLFKEILNREPSHIDIHKYTYLESGYPVIIEFAKDHDLPFAHYGIAVAGGTTTAKQSISAIDYSLDAIIEWLEAFKDDDSGELVLHPGMYDHDCQTSLNYERSVDVEKARVVKGYCDEKGVEVVNFSSL